MTYSYNPIGNMTYNSQVGNYTYPTNGIRPHAVTQAGTNTYVYDANGNMTSGAGRTIAYNYDNMPKSITKSGVTTTLVYDYAGQRIKKTASSVTTVYIGKLYECTSSVCTKYVFGGSQRIASKKQGVVYYYHTDHLGSSSIITDSAGNKAEEIYYYPYGGTRLNQGAVNVKHKFTGQEEDAETGLYYYGARYYDPILGRFISADTIVPLPFHPQTLNRYAYAYNNPIVLQDLNGHEPGYYWSTWDWLYGYNNSQPNNYVEINTTQYNNNITMFDSYSIFNTPVNNSVNSQSVIDVGISNDFHKYINLRGSDEDASNINLQTQLVFSAVGEYYKVKDLNIAIAYSVTNRVNSKDFPDTYEGVIYQTNNGIQYSEPWEKGKNGKPSLWQLSANPETLTGRNAKAYSAIYSDVRKVYYDLIPDASNGATYFHSIPPDQLSQRSPWFYNTIQSGGIKETTVIKPFYFYK